MLRPDEGNEEAPSDELGAYLATVRCDLNATQWGRWRANRGETDRLR